MLKLKQVCRVTDRTVDEVIDGCQGLLSHPLSFVKASVRDILGNAGISFFDVEGLDEAFRNVPGLRNDIQAGEILQRKFQLSGKSRYYSARLS